MTFSTPTNAIQRMTNITIAFTIGLSILLSQINPLIVKATVETTPQSSITDDSFVTEEPAVVLPPQRLAKKTMTVVATAYSSEVGQTDSTPCIPAMYTFNLCEYFKKNGVEDTVAANFLPLGTEVRFPDIYGDKVFIVRDRMNAKYNGKSRIDFWKKDRGGAVKFGVNRMKMEVLEKEKVSLIK